LGITQKGKGMNNTKGKKKEGERGGNKKGKLLDYWEN